MLSHAFLLNLCVLLIFLLQFYILKLAPFQIFQTHFVSFTDFLYFVDFLGFIFLIILEVNFLHIVGVLLRVYDAMCTHPQHLWLCVEVPFKLFFPAHCVENSEVAVEANDSKFLLMHLHVFYCRGDSFEFVRH